MRRRRFAGDLKAKVAPEALRGDRTLQEIASKHHEVAPTNRGHLNSRTIACSNRHLFGDSGATKRDPLVCRANVILH